MKLRIVLLTMFLFLCTFTFNAFADTLPAAFITIDAGNEVEIEPNANYLNSGQKYIIAIGDSENITSQDASLETTEAKLAGGVYVENSTNVDLSNLSLSLSYTGTDNAHNNLIYSVTSEISLGKDGQTFSVSGRSNNLIYAENSAITIGDNNQFIIDGKTFGGAAINIGRESVWIPYHGGLQLLAGSEVDIGNGNVFYITTDNTNNYNTNNYRAYAIMAGYDTYEGDVSGVTKVNLGIREEGASGNQIVMNGNFITALYIDSSEVNINNELSITENTITLATSPNSRGVYMTGRFVEDTQAPIPAQLILNDTLRISLCSVKSSAIIFGPYSTIKSTDEALETENALEIITTGDYSHAIQFEFEDRNATHFTSTTSSTDSSIFAVNNADISLSGEYSNVLFIIAKNRNVNTVDLYFENWNARVTDAGYLVTAAGTSDRAYLAFKDSFLSGDVFAGTLSYMEISRSFPSANLPNAPFNQFPTYSIELTLLGESEWQGSKVNEHPYRDVGYPTFFNGYSWQIDGEYAVNPVNLYLRDTSKWTIIKDSNVDLLDMESRETLVNFFHDYTAEDNEYEYLFAYVETLSGEGSFLMNVDMTEGSSVGDYFYAESGSGTFYVKIDHDNKGGEDELLLIEVNEITDEINGGELEFILDHRNSRVSIGSSIYALEGREPDYIDDHTWQWFLKRLSVDVKLEEDFKSGLFGLFEFAKAIDATLSDELLYGKNRIWSVPFYKLQNFSHSDLTSDLKQQIAGGTVGLNQKIGNNFSVGEFFGLNLGYQDIGEGSVGHISNLTAGIYAGYANKGFSISAYLRVSDYINDLRLEQSAGGILAETLNNYGLSASVQISQKIYLFGSNLFLEPKAKASYTYVAEQTYNIGGMEILSFTEKGLVTWLGARIGTQDDADRALGYYLEAGWIHDTNPSISYLAVGNDPTEKVDVTLGKNRLEVGVGITSSPLGVSTLSFEAKYARGEGIREPIKLKISASASF